MLAGKIIEQSLQRRSRPAGTNAQIDRSDRGVGQRRKHRRPGWKRKGGLADVAKRGDRSAPRSPPDLRFHVKRPSAEIRRKRPLQTGQQARRLLVVPLRAKSKKVRLGQRQNRLPRSPRGFGTQSGSRLAAKRQRIPGKGAVELRRRFTGRTVRRLDDGRNGKRSGKGDRRRACEKSCLHEPILRTFSAIRI